MVSRLEFATKHMMSLGSQLSVDYSPYTGKWFATVQGMDLSDGLIMTGMTEHMPTPEEAVIALFDRLVEEATWSIPFVQVREKRITVLTHEGRRAFCWNGVAFYSVQELA
jgi:hypothetical protein